MELLLYAFLFSLFSLFSCVLYIVYKSLLSRNKCSILSSRQKKIKDFEFSLIMRGDLPQWILNDKYVYEEWKKKQRKDFYEKLQKND